MYKLFSIRNTLLVLLYLINAHASSQNFNTEMFSEGMEYTYAGASTYDELISHPQGGTFIEEVSRDGVNIINGKEYAYMYISRGYLMNYEPSIHYSCSHDEFYNCHINLREQDGIVYVPKEEYLALFQGENYINMIEGNGSYIPYKETPDGELILYDFNMGLGDKYLSVAGHEDISVAAIDQIETMDGLTRKRLTLSNGYMVVEGLGCVNSPGMLLCYLNPLHQEHYGTLLGYRNSSINMVVLYQYLADAVGIEHISLDEKMTDSQIYDLQGRKLNEVPDRGLYIQNGKIFIKN